MITITIIELLCNGEKFANLLLLRGADIASHCICTNTLSPCIDTPRHLRHLGDTRAYAIPPTPHCTSKFFWNTTHTPYSFSDQEFSLIANG